MQETKIDNSNIIHFILDDGNIETCNITYKNEADRLHQIQKIAKHINTSAEIFQIIFYHWESGNVILDKALWGI